MRTMMCAWTIGMLLAVTASGQEPPALKMQAVATPVRTSRIFQTAMAPNPRGGWNYICQSMNYKSTGGREKVTIDLGNGRHYLAYKNIVDRPEAEWVILDLAAGTSKVVKLPGFHAAEISGGGCLAGNGRVFFSVDYGHIYYYEPAEETIKVLGRVHDSIEVLRQFYKLELGPDGFVYGASQSTNGVASVIRINPDTLEWKYITGVGLPGRRSLTYGYYIAVDPPWIYVGVGQGKWELGAVNFDTGEIKVLDQRDGEDSRVVVSRKADYCVAEIHGAPERVNLALRGGAVVARAKHGEKLEVSAQPVTYPQVEWKNTKPMDLGKPPEWDRERRPVVSGQGDATLFWRSAETDAWREARFTVQNTEPPDMESLTLLPDGSILGNTDQYHGWFRYYPDADRSEYFGRGGPSGSKTTIVDGRVYFAGYPNTGLSVYDPAQPWTNLKTGQAGDAGANPTHLGFQGQGRSEAHHAVALAAAKGRVYTQGQRERWSTGTGLCAYDIASKTFTALGQENKDLEPVNMIAMPTLERLIVSGAKKDAQLLIYDLDLKEVGRIDLKSGLASTGYLLPVSDTRFVGWYGEPDAKKTTVYLYDLAAMKVVCSTEVEEQAVWVTLRPADNSMWLLADQQMFRMNPETLALKPVGILDHRVDMPTHGGRSGHRARPLWRGSEFYGSSSGTLVRSPKID